ncbi:hypothetical protein P8452_09791 [Trifolium repens]|jgi:hypothetical protein|nr:hypothetical protein QL285_053327 [Trifolium repens]WJX20208.1 hypothetical protein P8452_09791 [Trifolium repens]
MNHELLIPNSKLIPHEHFNNQLLGHSNPNPAMVLSPIPTKVDVVITYNVWGIDTSIQNSSVEIRASGCWKKNNVYPDHQQAEAVAAIYGLRFTEKGVTCKAMNQFV